MQRGSREAADAAIHHLPPREPAVDESDGRNPGTPLDLDWVASVAGQHLGAIERRAADPARRAAR